MMGRCPQFWALGTSLVSLPLVACIQESFPADLGGRREGVTSLLPFNLDSWVYGRKHGLTDAVIKAIPEARGGRERSSVEGWFPHLSPSLQPKSQPQSFSDHFCLSSTGTDTVLHPREAELCVTAHQRSHCTCVRLSSDTCSRLAQECREGSDPETKGSVFTESTQPPVHIPEESGQSLVRTSVGGADPILGQEQGRSLGLSTLSAAEACQPTPAPGDLGAQRLLQVLPSTGPRAEA